MIEMNKFNANIDNLEAKRNMILINIRKLKADKIKLQSQIDELQIQSKQIEKQELTMFKGRRLQTNDWRFTRTQYNPARQSSWQITQADDSDKVTQLQAIDDSLLELKPNLKAIRIGLAEGVLAVNSNHVIYYTDTGQILPYKAILKPDSLTVKAVADDE